MSPTLTERIRVAMPEFIKLSDDELLQLKAHLSVPTTLRKVDIEVLYYEANSGDRTQSNQVHDERTFQKHLGRLLKYNEMLTQNVRDQGVGRKKQGGRPSDTDVDKDQRIADAWATRRYKTHEELGREVNLSKNEIKRALDRHRKRPKPIQE